MIQRVSRSSKSTRSNSYGRSRPPPLASAASRHAQLRADAAKAKRDATNPHEADQRIAAADHSVHGRFDSGETSLRVPSAQDLRATRHARTQPSSGSGSTAKARTSSSAATPTAWPKDVDAALNKIVQEQGGLDPEKASEYVEKMRAEKRYKRDVY